MNQEEMLKHEQVIVSNAIKKSLSGLKPDPELAKKVIQLHKKQNEKKKVRKR